MKISPIINGNVPSVKEMGTSKNVFKFAEIKDTANFTKPVNNNIIDINRAGKNLHVTFTGQLQNPLKSDLNVIQMKLSDVMNHQKGSAGAKVGAADDSLVKLAKSDWKDGRNLSFTITDTINGQYKNKEIAIVDPEFGEIGKVPYMISTQLGKLIESNPKEKNNFKFKLTNINGGVSSAYSTIGAQVALKYIGNDEKIKKYTENTFSSFLNSEKKSVADSVTVYQPSTSPKEVLERIFDIEGQKKGLGHVRQIKDAITAISSEINNPKNKNILVLGHTSPDGDTVGCVLGMQAAIKGAFPERNVDMGIDDTITSNFSNLPGIKDIKKPYNGYGVYSINKNIELLERNKNSDAAKKQIELLKSEAERLQDPSKTFDEGAIEGNPKKYDLVIMLDTPTPGRTSKTFKKYFETAGKTIFIDHHPHREADWAAAKPNLGLDLEKIKNDNLFLVCDTVPAATQIVTAVMDKAGVLGKMFANSVGNAKQFVAGIAAGTLTDTVRFAKTASHDSKDYAKKVEDRPSYNPEGMVKWLYAQAEKVGENINKNWMRTNLEFELPNTKIKNTDGTEQMGAGDMVTEKALKSRIMNPELGVGIINISYDDMQEIYEKAHKQDERVHFNDVYSAFKTSPVLNALKSATSFTKPEEGSLEAKASETYTSPFDDDRLAVFSAQLQKQGEINKFSQIADKNTFSFSFRSGGKSNLAQIAATLFGGGGHSQAAGGNISMKDLSFDSKLKVMIKGKEEADFSKIFNTVQEVIAGKAKGGDIKIVMSKDDKGKSIPELIDAITAEQRKTQSLKAVA